MSAQTASSRAAAAQVPVPEAIGGILLQLVSGWTPAALIPGAIASFRLNEVDFTDMAPQVEVAGDRLVVTLKGAHFNPRLRELLPFPMGASSDGTLADGGTFRGADILRINLAADLTIEMNSWSVLLGDEPSLWVGRVDGSIPVDFGGNLVVERVRDDGLRFGRACHFRLAGTYSYYLVQSGGHDARTWHLVVDTTAGIPGRDALERDFQVLQFVLGRQLRVPLLIGVGAEGQASAMTTGPGTRANLQPHSAPPVPINRDNDNYVDDSWAALMFDRVTSTLVARPETRTALWMAIDSYLDAMGRYLDADYLRLHVGLEAFAYWALRSWGGEEKMLVEDKQAWKKWVEDNSGAIREHATDGLEQTLLDKVRGVYRLSSGRVVPSAFGLHDLTLTKEMKDELKRRDTVIHQGLMSPEGYDVDRDLRSISMVRTLLVALISKAAGYGGAINGWEVGPAGYPVEPSEWWETAEEDRQLARRIYIAEGPASHDVQPGSSK